jgi:hypothetical protein
MKKIILFIAGIVILTSAMFFTVNETAYNHNDAVLIATYNQRLNSYEIKCEALECDVIRDFRRFNPKEYANNLDDIPEVQAYISQLQEYDTIEINYFHQSAVAGELAGMAVDILMSKEVQITLSSIAMGQILWQMIQTLKKLGKRFSISSKTAKLIALFKTEEDVKKQRKSVEVSNYLVYGPMSAELDIDLSTLCANEDTQSDDMYFSTYFLAVVFPRPKGRVKTIWYLFQHSGDILASWSTQTLAERMPNFLNPHVKSEP